MGHYDYRGQLMRYSMTAKLAEDLFHVWIGTGEEDARVLEFGTLTSRVPMPLDFWRRVTDTFFQDIYLEDLGATGMYSFEKTAEEQIHCHFVAVRDVKTNEYVNALLQIWKQNVGFHKVEPARHILNVAGYTVKEWIDGESKTRALVEEPTFFGEGWTSKSESFEWEDVELPGFEAEG